jgi:hypothetical protein
VIKVGKLLLPVFYGFALVQMAVRSGFSIRVHPLSLLELGRYGWVQSLNFALCGVILILLSVGLIRSRELRILAALFGISGIGLLIAAAFVPDPYMGFPPGSALPRAPQMSTHAKLHGVGFMVTFLPLIAASFVVSRQARAQNSQLARLSLIAGVLMPLIIAVGFMLPAFTSIGFFIAGLIAFGWVYLFSMSESVEVRNPRRT